jgi:membrane AbrB-like protein
VLRIADPNRAARIALTLGLSLAGGLGATWAGLPAGWLSGGILAVALTSLAGFDSEFPDRLRAPVYLVLGLYAGSGVSPETLDQMQTWPASFAILGVSVIALIAGSYWWLHACCGWDRNAALLASLPGALSFVMAAAEGLKTDMKKVAIAQSLRLILLVEIIPLAALLLGHSAGSPGAAAIPTASAADLLILLAAGLGAALMMEGLRLPGGWMLGGLVASAFLLLSGTVQGGLPGILVVPCMVALAALTGSRFRPGDMAILPRIAGPALVSFAIASIVSVISAVAVTLIFGVSIIQTLLAFAPGALDALIILAYQMDIDPAYVAAHHVARFLALVAAVPLLARWLDRNP